MNARHNEMLQIAFHCALPIGSLVGVPHDRCRSLVATCNGEGTSHAHFRAHLHSM